MPDPIPDAMEKTMQSEWWIAVMLGFLAIGCDQQASIGERSDGGTRTDGSSSSGCVSPACAGYVFPPSPRLVRAQRTGYVERTIEIRYDEAGHIVSGDEEYTSPHTYEAGRLVRLQRFRNGVQGIDMMLSWEGERFLGYQGWLDEWYGVPDPDGRFPRMISSALTYGELGIDRIDYRLEDANGTVKRWDWSIAYGATGMIDRIDAIAPEGSGSGDIVFFYDERGRVSRARVTTAGPWELDFEYDASGRVEAITRRWGDRVSVYSYFYNSAGLIARIEDEAWDPSYSSVLELTYEPGTTPSVQYHHGQLITLYGEVAPLVGIRGRLILDRTVDYETSWLGF